MSSGTGSAEIDFGAHPGANEASVTVASQTDILATSKVESYVMADDATTDHTASDHRYFAVFAGLSCGTPVEGDGFTIYARSTEKLTGKFAVRWVWVD